MSSIVIPRTDFDCPTFRCDHPKWESNITRSGQCKFCVRVRNLNADGDRPVERRRSRVTAEDRLAAAMR